MLKSQQFNSKEESRAIAAYMALAIGDALGAHTEFKALDYNRVIYKDKFTDFKNPNRCFYGQYTDDTSMSLCVADSLLVNEFKFNGVDLRYRFLL